MMLISYLSSANANPPPCLTRAGHNSMLIFTSLLNQCRLRIDDVLGRLKQPSVAILVPLGATLGAPGRPGEPLWTLWGGTLGALARPGDSFWHSLAQGRKKSTKREPNSRSPGRILLPRGCILRCFLAYFAKNRRFFKWRFPDRFFHRFWSASGSPGTSKNKQNHCSVARKQGFAKIKKGALG